RFVHSCPTRLYRKFEDFAQKGWRLRKRGGVLALRELEPSPRTALAVFLAFFHAAVAGEETGAAEGGFQGGIVLGEGAAEAHDDGAGLAGVAAAVAAGPDVHFAAGAGDFQRAEDRF